MARIIATEEETREIIRLLDHPENKDLSELTIKSLTQWLERGQTAKVLDFLRHGTKPDYSQLAALTKKKKV